MFKKVVTQDWCGKLGTFEVIRTKKHQNKKYTCTFINSDKDKETQLVDEHQLHLGETDLEGECGVHENNR